MQQKIVTFLSFNKSNAEEAMNYYLGVFKGSKKLAITRWGDVAPGPKGAVLAVMFELEGQQYVGLNGGPPAAFSQAISLLINCDTQAEIDHYWSKLSEGGESYQCGWLKDKFGVSWQVCPRLMMEILASGDQKRIDRAMAAMMTMTKFDLSRIKAAYEGK